MRIGNAAAPCSKLPGLDNREDMRMEHWTPVPHLVVNDAEAAIEFYGKAFGAILETKHPAEDGKRLMHAHLRMGSGALMLHDEFPEFGDQGA